MRKEFRDGVRKFIGTSFVLQGVLGAVFLTIFLFGFFSGEWKGSFSIGDFVLLLVSIIILILVGLRFRRRKLN